MTKIPLIAVVLASLLAATPSLAGERRAAVIMGIGAITCSEFLAVDRPVEFGEMAFNWAQGFMTATNIERDRNHQLPLKNLNGVPLDVQQGRLLIYCGEQGLLIKAIEELYDSLPDK